MSDDTYTATRLESPVPGLPLPLLALSVVALVLDFYRLATGKEGPGFGFASSRPRTPTQIRKEAVVGMAGIVGFGVLWLVILHSPLIPPGLAPALFAASAIVTGAALFWTATRRFS